MHEELHEVGSDLEKREAHGTTVHEDRAQDDICQSCHLSWPFTQVKDAASLSWGDTLASPILGGCSKRGR